ncbi:hypothetical protein COO60DRAFT_1269914, partial [Scenedesmus sp. NREL 46B-D3]
RADKGPLVQGCSCLACRSHSRAHLQLLLHTHEMLASVLLELHNTHWWWGFLGQSRGDTGGTAAAIHRLLQSAAAGNAAAT